MLTTVINYIQSRKLKFTVILFILSILTIIKKKLKHRKPKLYQPSTQVLLKLQSLKLLDHYDSHPKREIRPSEYAYLRGSLYGDGKLEYGYSHYDSEMKKLVFFAVLGNRVCGHPSIVHGGMVAGIFDDIFGELFFSHAHQKYFGYTANLTINYRSKMPAESVVVFVCHVDRQEGRKVYVKGVAKSAEVEKVEELSSLPFGEFESVVYAEAEALFIIPREEYAKLPQPFSPSIAI